jgi:hypothetical protein
MKARRAFPRSRPSELAEAHASGLEGRSPVRPTLSDDAAGAGHEGTPYGSGPDLEQHEIGSRQGSLDGYSGKE